MIIRLFCGITCPWICQIFKKDEIVNASNFFKTCCHAACAVQCACILVEVLFSAEKKIHNVHGSVFVAGLLNSNAMKVFNSLCSWNELN